MMSREPAFQFFARDWLSSASVSLMTPAEEGAYVRLLALAWLEPDCGLPDDDKVLAHLSRLGRRVWAKGSGATLRAQFRSEGGRLYNDRLLRCLSERDEYRAMKSEAGKRGNDKRWADRRRDIAEASQGDRRGIAACEVTGIAKASPSFSFSSSSSSTLSPPTPALSPPATSNQPPEVGYELWHGFLDACASGGLPYSTEDAIGMKHRWRKLDFEQRENAIRGIIDRIAVGQYGPGADEKYIPNAVNYLGERHWERGVRRGQKRVVWQSAPPACQECLGLGERRPKEAPTSPDVRGEGGEDAYDEWARKWPLEPCLCSRKTA